jgi:hypothetical protein
MLVYIAPDQRFVGMKKQCDDQIFAPSEKKRVAEINRFMFSEDLAVIFDDRC